MATDIAKYLSPPRFEDKDKNRLAGIMHTMLLTLLLSSFIFMFIAAMRVNVDAIIPFLLLDVVFLLSLMLIHRGELKLPAYIIPTLILLLVTYRCYVGNGLHDISVFGYMVVISVACLLLGKNAPIIFTGLCIISITGLYLAESQGLFVTPYSDITGIDDVIGISAMLGIAAVVLRIMMSNLIQSLEQTRHNEEEIRRLNATLELRIAARTRDLRLAAEVSRQATHVLDLKKLLPELAEMTRQTFSLYYVSIFLYRPDTGELQLEAATGEAGRQMMKRNKSFNLATSQGLIALCGRERKITAINDVRATSHYMVNPNLPSTLSEAVVPMVVGTDLIGVLDLQASDINRFSEDDLKVLTTLAEQTAIAVRNAQLFAEVHEARELAEKANSVKSQFLASMSHELRTPLNAILNFTQFVTSGMIGPVTEEQLDLLNKVVDSGKHLLNLINDVLDISKIEAGALKLFVEDNINLAQESQSLAEIAKTLIKDKPVELVLNIQNDLPLIVGDRRRIRQIMLNLISNACKFTDTGTITLNLARENDHLTFAVHDTGPGIAPEDHRIIFESFRQTQIGLHQTEGTGLGLPISKHLAEAHDGRLWLESTIGKGSSFYVSLPVRASRLVAQLKTKVEANNVA